MTEAPKESATPDALPAARIRRRRPWAVYLVWLVPLIAAGMAGYLVASRLNEYGPTITIMFRDAAGLKPRQSEVTGGIAFATPDAAAPPAREDTIFVLHDKPEKEWLSWMPKIPLAAGN